MVDGDQLGIQALVDRLDDADRLLDNEEELISPLDTRNAITDTIRTLQHLRQYQAVCYYKDGTRSVKDFTDGTSATTRASELTTWLATLNDDCTVYIPPGQYEVGATPVTISQSGITVFAYGAVFKRGDNIDSQNVVHFNGSGSCDVYGMTVDGNRAGNWQVITTKNNAIEADGYSWIRFTNTEAYDVHTTYGSHAPRCIEVSSSVNTSVFVNCYVRNGGWSCLRIRSRNQEYYGTVCEITEPSVLAADKNEYTFSGTTLTATDGTHSLSVDDRIVFLSTTTLPTGLEGRWIYYVKTTPTADTFTVALTSGGTAISLSGGAGTHYVYKVDSTTNRDRFYSCDLGEIDSFKWYGGEWKSTLPIAMAATITPDNRASSNKTMTCSDDSPDALFTSGAAHGFSVGNTVFLRLEAAGALPTGFNHFDVYWVTEVPTTTTLKLSYLEFGENIAFQDAGSGTIQVAHIYPAPSVLIDGLKIDCRYHDLRGSSDRGWIKVDNLGKCVIKNVYVPFAGHHGWHKALLSVDGPSEDPLAAGVGDSGGRRMDILLEACRVETGGILHLGGIIHNLTVNDCDFGNERHIANSIVEGLLAFHAEFNRCRFRSASLEMIELNAAWDDAHELFFNRCAFYFRSDSDRLVLSNDLVKGGFYRCEKENFGTGGAYFNSTSERRLQNNLAHPNSWTHLLWTSGATGTGTYSDVHPTEGFASLTGQPGQVIISDDAGAAGTTNDVWVWDATNSQWDGH
jgi:hypothetical protein